MPELYTGGCLCGKVQYEVRGPLRDVIFCHCTMCQRHLGGVGPHTKTLKENLILICDSGLAWYESSTIAKRGFCRECGSSLFWNPANQDSIGILAGSLDDSAMLKTIGHIFVAEKASYMPVTDEQPQFSGSSHGALPGDF
ncbi:MAG: GFA family protein [Granulosicoccus sp.]|nr:GFA family protein [Granulosicoccus sp.]